MKQLILIRHAKAVAGSVHLHDFDRVLQERGEQEANIMGKILAQKNKSIDAFISSPAARTKATSELIATHLNFSPQHLQFQPLIYEASTRTLFQIVTELNNDWKTVILVGHNPAFHDLASYLLGTRLFDFPTCTICGLSFNFKQWDNLQANSAQLTFFETPRG
jgi:phosphohistidine phosphatase